MSIHNDSIKKIDGDSTAMTKALEFKLSSPAVEAMETLHCRAAETALKATQTPSLSREFQEMQRTQRLIPESGLLKAMREIESPILAAVRSQELWPAHLKAAMGTGQSAFVKLST